MADTRVNPLPKIGNDSSIPPPTSYQYDLEDVSASDAGRTEDVQMHKKRIGQVRALTVSWSNVTTQVAKKILRAAQPEYVNARFLDPLLGDFDECEMYVGNRTAPLYNATLGLWSNISFKLIERAGGEIK